VYVCKCVCVYAYVCVCVFECSCVCACVHIKSDTTLLKPRCINCSNTPLGVFVCVRASMYV